MNASERIPETEAAACAAAYIPVPFTIIPTDTGLFALFTARGSSRIFIGFFDAEALTTRLAANYSDTVESYNSISRREAAKHVEAAKPKKKLNLTTLDLDLSTLTL